MGDFIGGIGHALWDAVLPSMATVIAGMLMLVVKRFLAKQGLDLTEKQEQRLKEIVVDKIHATEEVAHRIPLTGVEKNAKTVNDAVVAATDDPTIPNPSVEKVAAVVDAELGKARAGYMPDPGRPGLGRI
jgi:hypothetical protein